MPIISTDLILYFYTKTNPHDSRLSTHDWFSVTDHSLLVTHHCLPARHWSLTLDP